MGRVSLALHAHRSGDFQAPSPSPSSLFRTGNWKALSLFKLSLIPGLRSLIPLYRRQLNPARGEWRCPRILQQPGPLHPKASNLGHAWVCGSKITASRQGLPGDERSGEGVPGGMPRTSTALLVKGLKINPSLPGMGRSIPRPLPTSQPVRPFCSSILPKPALQWLSW